MRLRESDSFPAHPRTLVEYYFNPLAIARVLLRNLTPLEMEQVLVDKVLDGVPETVALVGIMSRASHIQITSYFQVESF